ncbi:O-acetylstemmadenine oxidase-like [Coffea arabica]|uniref:O-acetylstemmadenine oxidase-like n=1 Tax=Coffea arabica TaxID=13443 RepID=A0A6P6S4X1_COFAR|nr:berberine bridge enzyme-like 25 [Coffea arabica]
MRIRSGGHDFEGTSYKSEFPFIILDRNLRSISIDIEGNSAWVESGVTIGELQYSIAEKSCAHAFPTGNYPGVGAGGHFSGGGVGNLIRKYGLAADNVIDAIMVNVNGRILDWESIRINLFWAIRGGEGASFGVILAWNIKLVHVPPVVTIFQISKTYEQGAVDLIDKWQGIAHKLSEDLLIFITVSSGNGTPTKAMFQSLFLGKVDQLLKVMEKSFPEMRLRKEDCFEMSWIESVSHFPKYQRGETIEALKNRIQPVPNYPFKSKSDLIHKPLPYKAIDEMWKWCSEVDFSTIIIFHPYGGIMNKISDSETPFPYRKGSNDVYGIAYFEAKVLGSMYFKNNFERLTLIKGAVYPDNFFYHEQSIPPLVSHAK